MYLAVGTLPVLAVVKWDCLSSKLCMPSQEILRKLLFIDLKSETKKHFTQCLSPPGLKVDTNL